MIYKKLFQIKKENIVLTRDTKAYNYKYATLDQIQNKLNPILEKLNLLVFHNIEDGFVKTTIYDLDDDSLVESKIKMSESTKAQDKGSEITYFRRYNLVSLLDLEVEDDDGKKASKPKPMFGIAEMKNLTNSKDPRKLLNDYKKTMEFSQDRTDKIVEFLKTID